jgi:hypothetical protein
VTPNPPSKLSKVIGYDYKKPEVTRRIEEPSFMIIFDAVDTAQGKEKVEEKDEKEEKKTEFVFGASSFGTTEFKPSTSANIPVSSYSFVHTG